MKNIITVCIAMLLSTSVWSQLQFDSVSTTRFYDTFNSGNSTVTFQHTCSGTNRVLIVSVMSCGGPSGTFGQCYANISSITYDGVNMNLIVNDSIIPGLLAHNTCWYLSNPTLGTHPIVVTYTDFARTATMAAFSFSGANTTSPIGALVTSKANGPSVSLPITTTNPNSIIVDFVGSTNGITNNMIIIDTNQIVKYKVDVASNDIECAGGYRLVDSIGTYVFSQSGYVGGSPLFATALEVVETPSSTLPVITSPIYSNITDSSANLGGTITSDGGCPITARGICWGTTTNTITNCVSDTGLSTGAFSMLLPSLPSNTVIYYKAFVTNCVGTAYTTIDDFTTNVATVEVQETPDEGPFSIFPNPSTGTVTISASSDDIKITICDIIGREISKLHLHQKLVTLNLEKPGIYLVQLQSNEGTKIYKLRIL